MVLAITQLLLDNIIALASMFMNVCIMLKDCSLDKELQRVGVVMDYLDFGLRQ